VIIFGSVRFLSKKITKPKQVQTDRFWFGFLGQKSVQTGLARFWLGFFRFWLGFFPVFFWFRFGLVFWFFAYKTEPAGFFKILIGLINFFLRFGFFGYFFSGFFGLISFFVFLLTPT
jgi:hypothetical protein